MSIYGRLWINELSRANPDGTVEKPEDNARTVGPDYTATGDEPDTQDNTPPEPDDDEAEPADNTDYTLDDPDVGGGAEPSDGNDNTAEVDYTEDDPEAGDDNELPVGAEASPDDPANATTDYTIPDDDDPEATDDGTNDSMGGNDDVGDTDAEPAAGTDYTADTGDTDSDMGGDNADGSTNGDNTEPSGTTDYTDDSDDTDTGLGDDGTDGNTSPDPEGNVEGDPEGGNELKQLEDEIFSSLTPEQIAIREEELKQQFIDLYDSTVQVTERIKSINKTLENSRVLEFISIKLLELKDHIYHIMTKSYNTKTYIENSTLYQQCLSVLGSIQKLLTEITPKTLENDDQNDK